MIEIEASFQQTVQRKDDHLDLCAQKNVESEVSAGWEDLQLPHTALPEISFDEIDIECSFNKTKKLSSPIFISSMTGGSGRGEEINERLASFAEKHRVAMGVGSQRVSLENREVSLFNLRKVAPKATLFANIGIVQFNYGLKYDDCTWIVEKLEADALILHANVLQESIQAEGDRNFSKLLGHIEKLKKQTTVPIILKETGCGLDPLSCQRALDAGVDILDIAGMGGTHWGYIEGLRTESRKELGKIFRNWGIPSRIALEQARQTLARETILYASGGIRNGLDAAKALFLGASMVGMALPFFKAALRGPEELESFYELQKEALKVALLCTGCKNLTELRNLK